MRLSKKEIEFLQFPDRFKDNPNYSRKLKHNIIKKLTRCLNYVYMVGRLTGEKPKHQFDTYKLPYLIESLKNLGALKAFNVARMIDDAVRSEEFKNVELRNNRELIYGYSEGWERDFNHKENEEVAMKLENENKERIKKRKRERQKLIRSTPKPYEGNANSSSIPAF